MPPSPVSSSELRGSERRLDDSERKGKRAFAFRDSEEARDEKEREAGAEEGCFEEGFSEEASAEVALFVSHQRRGPSIEGGERERQDTLQSENGIRLRVIQFLDAGPHETAPVEWRLPALGRPEVLFGGGLPEFAGHAPMACGTDAGRGRNSNGLGEGSVRRFPIEANDRLILSPRCRMAPFRRLC